MLGEDFKKKRLEDDFTNQKKRKRIKEEEDKRKYLVSMFIIDKYMFTNLNRCKLIGPLLGWLCGGSTECSL